MTRPSRLLIAAANALGWAADKLLTRCFASAPEDLMTNREFAIWLVAAHEADRNDVIAERAAAYLEAFGMEPFAEWERDFAYDQEGDQ